MKKRATFGLMCLAALLCLCAIVLSAISCAQTKKEPVKSEARQGSAGKRNEMPPPPQSQTPQSANAKQASTKGRPPVEKQVEAKDFASFKVEPDTPTVTGADQALFDAVKRGDLEAVKILIGAKANVNLRRNGLTPLLLVAARENAGSNDTEILKQLLEHEADVKATNGAGESALFLAVKNAQTEMVRLLLAHKADPNIASHHAGKSETPLGLVKASLHDKPKDAKYLEIEKLLKEAGAK